MPPALERIIRRCLEKRPEDRYPAAYEVAFELATIPSTTTGPGLPLLNETEERLVFKCGGDTRLIVSRSTVGTSDTQTQMVWRVPDIHAALADLRARGVQVEEYSAPEPVTVDGIADMGHSWSAWFIDPSRNVLGVVQPKG